MTNSTLAFLLGRQSASALTGSEISDNQLATIIQVATTVPDHGKLRPYRFVAIGESGKAAFGESLATVVDVARGGIPDELKEKFRKRSQLAPTQIAVIFSPKPSDKAPEWEQLVTASCTGYAMILAATAMGLGANWRSSSVMEGAAITEFFAMQPGEKLLGWVNVGIDAKPTEKVRPDAEIGELLTSR